MSRGETWPPRNSRQLVALARSEELQRCRSTLSAHIKIQTGLCVEPSKVRLRTTWRQPYKWDYPQEIASLFSKNLSMQGVRILRYLHQNVGETFKAVSKCSGEYVETMPALSPSQALLEESTETLSRVSSTTGSSAVESCIDDANLKIATHQPGPVSQEPSYPALIHCNIALFKEEYQNLLTQTQTLQEKAANLKAHLLYYSLKASQTCAVYEENSTLCGSLNNFMSSNWMFADGVDCERYGVGWG